MASACLRWEPAGKSSFFDALRAEGAAVASSDEERARGGNFDQALGQLLRTEPLVCYDKNIPNMEGLAKLCKVLGHAERQHRVQIKVPRAARPRAGTPASHGCCRRRG